MTELKKLKRTYKKYCPDPNVSYFSADHALTESGEWEEVGDMMSVGIYKKGRNHRIYKNSITGEYCYIVYMNHFNTFVYSLRIAVFNL